jgi:hypothetical protein
VPHVDIAEYPYCVVSYTAWPCLCH